MDLVDCGLGGLWTWRIVDLKDCGLGRLGLGTYQIGTRDLEDWDLGLGQLGLVGLGLGTWDLGLSTCYLVDWDVALRT